MRISATSGRVHRSVVAGLGPGYRRCRPRCRYPSSWPSRYRPSRYRASRGTEYRASWPSTPTTFPPKAWRWAWRATLKLHRQRQPVILTVAEVARVAETIRPELRALVLISAWCGLRWGLKPSNCAARTSAWTPACSPWVVGPLTGTAAASTRPRRQAPCRGDTAAHPRRHQTHLAEHVGTDAEALLFSAPRGGCHLRDTTFRRHFNIAPKSIGREGVRVHDLRHFAGTQTARVGASLADSMSRLGHSTHGGWPPTTVARPTTRPIGAVSHRTRWSAPSTSSREAKAPSARGMIGRDGCPVIERAHRMDRTGGSRISLRQLTDEEFAQICAKPEVWNTAPTAARRERVGIVTSDAFLRHRSSLVPSVEHLPDIESTMATGCETREVDSRLVAATDGAASTRYRSNTVRSRHCPGRSTSLVPVLPMSCVAFLCHLSRM